MSLYSLSLSLGMSLSIPEAGPPTLESLLPEKLVPENLEPENLLAENRRTDFPAKRCVVSLHLEKRFRMSPSRALCFFHKSQLSEGFRETRTLLPQKLPTLL